MFPIQSFVLFIYMHKNGIYLNDSLSMLILVSTVFDLLCIANNNRSVSNSHTGEIILFDMF